MKGYNKKDSSYQGKRRESYKQKDENNYLKKRKNRSRKIKKDLKIKIIIMIMAFIFALILSLQTIGTSNPKDLSLSSVIPTSSPYPSSSSSPSNPYISPKISNKESTPYPAKKIIKAIPALPLSTIPNTIVSSPRTYTQVDSIAIMGAFSLARQTPSASSKDYSTFLNKLKIAKDNPGNSTLDLAILGNKLVDYVISKNGFNAPVCYAIEAPAVENQSPRQGVWVIYFQPALPPSRQTLVLVKFGVTNCAQATQAVSQVKTDAQRLILSNSSRSVITAAIGKVPSSFLTPFGKALLDESRGLAPKVKK